MKEVQDFFTEAYKLYCLIKSAPAPTYQQETSFKGWTTNQILTHLWMWNWAAEISSTNPDTLQVHIKNVMPFVMSGNMREYEKEWAGEQCIADQFPHSFTDADILEKWWASCESLALTFNKLSPKDRLKWAGPDMSVRSSITARLMETWSHAQAIYDHLNEERDITDSIKNIAYLGVNTFGWSFKNRKLDIPEITPYIYLTAPSGEIWEWGDKAFENQESIRGSALDFCHVVTQTRNILDTDLKISGDVSKQWMSIAQCFAGPPETPPKQGSRL